MKETELRIGNYVYPFDDIYLVDSKTILKDCIKVTPKDFKNTIHLEPIPLTEEWLIKFGFVRSSEKTTRLGYLKYNTFDLNGGCGYGNVFTYGSAAFNHIKHVHQLQNIYFALTNEELTIK